MTHFQMAVSQPPFEIQLVATTRWKDNAFIYLLRVVLRENIHMGLRYSRSKIQNEISLGGSIFEYPTGWESFLCIKIYKLGPKFQESMTKMQTRFPSSCIRIPD